MSEAVIISACGDVCTLCPRYMATLENDTVKLKSLAELWYRLGFRDSVLEAQEMKCSGCNKERPCSHGINSCDKLSSIQNCGQCKDYPCEKINNVFKKNLQVEGICKARCTLQEYEMLKSAFLMKKEVLDRFSQNLK